MMTENTFADSFLAGFDNSEYPTEFLHRYEMMECLAHHEGGETFLVRENLTGETCVAKCYPQAARPSVAIEQSLLKGKRQPGLPEVLAIYENENMVCVVRAYIVGQPLDEVARQKALTEKQAVRIALQLCDTLSFLHAQQPAIIHRDIKPQNIILDEHGSAVLIDFGISRNFEEDAREDTLCFGTRHFAAPEQYGFSQTDARSDIYALGVLLGWLLTGENDLDEIKKKLPGGRLKKIVLKCAEFDPCARYKSAAQVKDALSGRADRRKTLAFLFAGGILALSLFAFSRAGFFPAQKNMGVRFTEPLIEQAALLALGKPQGTALTEADLLGVREMLIFGNHVAADEVGYRALVDRFARNDPTVVRGSITHLDDLTRFPNLRRVTLGFQNISDITPLASLKYLEHADLKHNPLANISPLAQNASLTYLSLFETSVTDLSALRSCPRLATLDIGATPIHDLSILQGLDGLTELHIGKMTLLSLEPLTALPLLERLYMGGINAVDLVPLLNLPGLRLVEISESRRAEADAIAQQTSFQIVYR